MRICNTYRSLRQDNSVILLQHLPFPIVFKSSVNHLLKSFPKTLTQGKITLGLLHGAFGTSAFCSAQICLFAALAVRPMGLHMPTQTGLLYVGSHRKGLPLVWVSPLFSAFPSLRLWGLVFIRGPDNNYAESLTVKQCAAPAPDISILQPALTASHAGTITWESEQVLKQTT